MKNLFVNKLKYIVECEDKSKYGATIPFEKGINIIYGPNSVGKSSTILGIIYALGIEKSLGIFSIKQNPFKPEFYDKIEGKKIIDSKVYLEINNGHQTITLCRPILGKSESCILKEGELNDFEKTKEFTELIADGKGVMSEDGLQRYLFEFLDWKIVEVPSYEGKPSKLYLENLAPLFFIEQRAGWSQIQARQITRYGIKEIKKVAFEYLMGLDKFDLHLIELEQKGLRQKINDLENDLENKEVNILIQTNAIKNSDDTSLLVDHLDLGRIPIKKAIKSLKTEINEKMKKIEEISEQKEKRDSFGTKGREKLREISNSRRVAADKVNLLVREIASYNNYIKSIEINRKKNLQLKKIDEMGAKLNISTCPICETLLSEFEAGCCHLCKENIQKISIPDENIAFLEDEKASFIKILKRKELDIKKAKHQLLEFKEKEREFTEKLNFQLETYYGNNQQKIREVQTEIDFIFNNIQKYKTNLNNWNELNGIRDEIRGYMQEGNKFKEQIKKHKQSSDDKNILKTILDNFKENEISLHLFKDRLHLANQLKLDKNENYTPYLDLYDLYNISSSSDNIRIIIGYYLSLLQTSIKMDNKKINFPNFLIFDEPRQQNLDEVDFNKFLELAERLDKNSYQLILTTHSDKDRKKVEKYIRKEMTSSKDYLLKPLKE